MKWTNILWLLLLFLSLTACVDKVEGIAVEDGEKTEEVSDTLDQVVVGESEHTTTAELPDEIPAATEELSEGAKALKELFTEIALAQVEQGDDYESRVDRLSDLGLEEKSIPNAKALVLFFETMSKPEIDYSAAEGYWKTFLENPSLEINLLRRDLEENSTWFLRMKEGVDESL